MFAQHQGLFFSPPCPTSEEAGRGHSWAGGWNIPDCVTLCSARNAGGKEKDKGGMFRVMVFVFPSKWQVCWGPACLEAAEHVPVDEKWQINSLFCFVCMCSFDLLIKMPLYQPTRFLSFALPVLSPSLPGESHQVTEWRLCCQLGPTTAVLFGVQCGARGFWDNTPAQSVLGRIYSCHWQGFILFPYCISESGTLVTGLDFCCLS